MSFINEILKHKSLSVVGIEKNTGKTECLNYVLRHLPKTGRRVMVSSIGIDGETSDQVTLTAKPEIRLWPGMFFATSEKHYRMRRLVSEVVAISKESTALGRIVVAKAITQGKVLLSGPSSNVALRNWMDEMRQFDIDLFIVDGALSRMSLASPTISESMILATGAAYSSNMSTLVQKTAFVVKLVNLEKTSEDIVDKLMPIQKGVWAVEDDGELVDMNVSTSLVSKLDTSRLRRCRALYVSGALTDGFVNVVRQDSKLKDVELIVRDFTKIFVSPQAYHGLLASGRRVTVLQKSQLVAVCVNPTAPNGYHLDSDKLCDTLSSAINLPVYDIVKNEYSF